jgi:hypothetical protein
VREVGDIIKNKFESECSGKSLSLGRENDGENARKGDVLRTDFKSSYLKDRKNAVRAVIPDDVVGDTQEPSRLITC